MPKKLVKCPDCGKEVKEGTGLSTHLKQWCKKAPGSRNYQGPKADATPEIPSPEAVMSNVSPRVAPENSEGENPPKDTLTEETPGPDPAGPEDRPNVLAPPQVQPDTTPKEAATNYTALIAIAIGVIVVGAGVYLWTRKNKPAARQPAVEMQNQGGVWYPPGGPSL